MEYQSLLNQSSLGLDISDLSIYSTSAGLLHTDGSTVSVVGAPLAVAYGGTNSATALNNNRIVVSSAGSLVESSALVNGQILIGSTGAAPVAANITAGSGIGITDGAGSITIANNGVTSITGTANQVIASSSTGSVTLSLPQSIATSSTVQFANIVNTGVIQCYGSATFGYLASTTGGVQLTQSTTYGKPAVVSVNSSFVNDTLYLNPGGGGITSCVSGVGYMGIGNTSPTENYLCVGSSTEQISFGPNTPTTGGFIRNDGSVLNISTKNGSMWYGYGSDATCRHRWFNNTTTQIAEFTTAGNIIFEAASDTNLKVGGASLTGGPSITLTNYSKVAPNVINWSVYNSGSTLGNALTFYNGTTAQMQLLDGGSTYIRSNLGIGTTSPDALLHVHQTSAADGSASWSHYTNLNTGSTINDGSVLGIANSGELYIWNREAQPIYFGTANNTSMTLTSTTLTHYQTNTNTSVGGGPSGHLLVNSSNTANALYEIMFNGANGVYGEIAGCCTNQTSSYGDILFATRSASGYSEKMRISSTGNVGIGTATPNKPLDVAGDIRQSWTSGTRTNYTEYFGDGGGNYFGGLSFDCNNRILYVNSKSNDTNGITIFNCGVGGSYSERMRINSTGVGINCTNPQGKFVVCGGTADYQSIEIGYTASLGGTNYLESINRNTGASVDMTYYISGSNNHRFFTNATEYMRIWSNGYVSVGNTLQYNWLSLGTNATFGISPIDTYYTDINQNIYYGSGAFRNRAQGGCSYMVMAGGSNSVGGINCYVGDSGTSTTAGTAVVLSGTLLSQSSQNPILNIFHGNWVTGKSCNLYFYSSASYIQKHYDNGLILDDNNKIVFKESGTTIMTLDNSRVGIAATQASSYSLRVAAVSGINDVYIGGDTGNDAINANGRIYTTGLFRASLSTPASSAASGSAGEICWDASYIYVCTATNTWKRCALSTF